MGEIYNMENENDAILTEIRELIRTNFCLIITGDSHSYETEPVRRLIDAYMDSSGINAAIKKLRDNAVRPKM